MNEDQQRRFIHHLEYQARRYKGILEDIFGQCDPNFAFGSVRKSSDNTPHTHFPNGYHPLRSGRIVVDIHIPDRPWEHGSFDQGTWQVAHECVHLLDPWAVGTIYLEEGLARWFQDEPRFHDAMVKGYIASNKAPSLHYDAAKHLVLRCMPQLIPAVRGIRASGIRIRDIAADVLAARLPDADKKTVESLCARFPRSDPAQP